VSKLLGHTSLTTMSRYLMNMQRSAMRRAVDRLERAAAEPKPSTDETHDGHVLRAAPPPRHSQRTICKNLQKGARAATNENPCK
jgi:hypothetical protein